MLNMRTICGMRKRWLARGFGCQIDFARTRGRVPGGIGHQLHDQRVVEIAVRLGHAHAGSDELV